MISRRRFLRTSATTAAVSAAGVAMMAIPSDAADPSDAIREAIAAHQHATVVWLAAIDVGCELEEAFYEKRRAARASGASEEACKAMKRDFETSPEKAAADEQYEGTSERESETLEALIDEPVTSLADLRAKLDYLLAIPDPEDAMDIVDDRTVRLMRSIVGGGLV